MENYFNYFTEIEEHFQKRRGTLLILPPVDWALMETWKDADIPLEAVLRGIDATFDRYDARPSKTRKINSLSYCAQEILAAAEEMKEAGVGKPRAQRAAGGLEPAALAAYLTRNADQLEAAPVPQAAQTLTRESARRLREMASPLAQGASAPLEELERRLTVMEEKLFAVLLSATSDDALVAVRGEADRDLAPYRRNMTAPQIEQLHKQYVHKRLLDKFQVPRLSLFYM
jgi:hypothetical protein